MILELIINLFSTTTIDPYYIFSFDESFQFLIDILYSDMNNSYLNFNILTSNPFIHMENECIECSCGMQMADTSMYIKLMNICTLTAKFLLYKFQILRLKLKFNIILRFSPFNNGLFVFNLLYYFPEILYIIFIILLLIFSLFFKKLTYLNNKKYNTPIIFNIISNINILILIYIIYSFYLNLYSYMLIFNGSLIITFYTQIIKIIISLFSILCLLSFKKYAIKNKINSFEYLILLNLSILSSFIMVSCNELIILYIAIEIQSFCFYILTSNKTNFNSANACLKYWILGSFISLIMLYGICFIYIETGLINFIDIKHFLYTNRTAGLFNYYGNILYSQNISNFVFFGFILIYIGLLFKLTVAPFHIWAPEVYEGAPSIMSMFFHAMPKISLIILLIKILNILYYSFYTVIVNILIINIILSLIIATFSTFMQVKVKNFLIYSSLAHIGYILLGLSTGTLEGIQSTVIYYIIYIISIINVWAIYIFLENKIKYLNNLKLLLKYNKVIGLCLIVSIFSMAGIPPFSGFIAKFYSFFVCLENNFYFIVLIAALISILSVFYYIKFIKCIYFENNNNNFYLIVFNNKNNKAISLVISLTTLLLIYFFIDPSLLYILAHKISLSICY